VTCDGLITKAGCRAGAEMGRVKIELDREHGTLAWDFVFTHDLIVHIFV